MSVPLDENLKYISVRNQWGCQKLPNSVLAAEGKGKEEEEEEERKEG
jgi:hypothetical protein